ncbi:MAG: ABC transporter ATP-binding protein [Deltaproteobacteria bacterium]
MHHDIENFEEQQLEKTYDIRIIRRLLPYATPYRLSIFASILLVMVITFLDLSIPYATKIAIDRYIVPSADTGRSFREKSAEKVSRKLTVNLSDAHINTIVRRYPHLFTLEDHTASISLSQLKNIAPADLSVLRKNDLRGVGWVSLAFLVIILLDFIFNFLQKLLMEYTGNMIMHDLRISLFHHIQNLSVSFFTRNPVGRLVTRVTNDIQNMHELFTSVISLVFKDFFLLLGIAVLLLLMNWKMALISFIILPAVGYTAVFFSGRIRDVFRRLRIKVSEINIKFSEMIDGITVIQAFGKSARVFETFSSLNHQNYLLAMRQIHVMAIFMPLIEVFGVLCVAVIVYYGGVHVISESISLGVLVAFISYMRMFFRPIRDLAEKFNVLQNAMASAERIFLILDTQDAIDTPSKPGTAAFRLRASADLDRIETIEFKNVSLAYSPSEPVLTQLTFRVHAGQTLAIVGPTGAGKTSLINLITRFYDPTEGSVLINGKDIRTLPIEVLRSKLALVTQDPFLFTDTVRKNIWRDETDISVKEIARVLSASNCADFIQGLPSGIDTVLSGGGSSLSSGERQLISIARAFAKNPELIILDEATSYIDSQTEQVIQDALANLMSGRTAFVVAHRLSTIKQANKILVIDKGKLMEEGTHEFLLQKKGFYYQLNHLQTCIGVSC